MRYEGILFDMDGTLVPMDMKEFIEEYFRLLAEKLAPAGIDPKSLRDAVWAGTFDMVKNDGTVSNEERFWIRFEQCTGVSRNVADPLCLDFYTHEFNDAKKVTGENPLARAAVRLACEKADHVALATNPLFPMAGQATRMGWVGLSPEDFCLVTSYESDSTCKPNPAYYLSVCERIGADPAHCLMIGNDERDDMAAASSVGMDCFLVTDTCVSRPDQPWKGRRGSFRELTEFLGKL